MQYTDIGEEGNTELRLFPKHASILERSGIAEGVASGRPYHSLTDKVRDRLVKQWGFAKRQVEGGGLVIPRYRPTGEDAPPQIRHDVPRKDQSGNACKYDSPKGSGGVIDVHPMVREKVMDLLTPLWLPESVKGEDALVSAGLAAVGFQGVWGWSKDKRPSPDWKHIPLAGREVILAFDSDTYDPTRKDLRRATHQFYSYLSREREAAVSIARVPEPGPQKVGVDDHLASYRDARDARDAKSGHFIHEHAKAMGGM